MARLNDIRNSSQNDPETGMVIIKLFSIINRLLAISGDTGRSAAIALLKEQIDIKQIIERNIAQNSNNFLPDAYQMLKGINNSMNETQLVLYNGTGKELFESSKNKKFAEDLVTNYMTLNPEAVAKVKSLISDYARSKGFTLPDGFVMSPVIPKFNNGKFGFDIKDGKSGRSL
jgi:hypothetical protein